jgi:hypothetical protein
MNSPCTVETSNLSYRWIKAVRVAMQHQGEIELLTVSITGFQGAQPEENSTVRKELDRSLRENGKFSCHTVANTIFPLSLWNKANGAQALYARYLRILPKLGRCCRVNAYGLYFGRMIQYGAGRINQLDHIITTRRDRQNSRRSALQVVIFDPAKDHTHQRRRGFPCLHQVTFTPTANGGLAVTGYYPVQYLYEKAYGNYLGLYRIGSFVAHELSLRLNKITCISNIAIFDMPGQNKFKDFIMSVEE